MSNPPPFTVAQPSLLEVEVPIVKLPPVAEPEKDSKAKAKSPSRPHVNPSPVQDLESHLRGMILSNGVATPSQANPEDGTLSSRVPPHLRLAPLAEQQEYIARHQNDAAPPNLVGAGSHLIKKIHRTEREIQNGQNNVPSLPTSKVTTNAVKNHSSTANGSPELSLSLSQSHRRSVHQAPRYEESQRAPNTFPPLGMNHSQQRQLPQHIRNGGRSRIEGGPLPKISAISSQPRHTYMNNSISQVPSRQYPDLLPPESFHVRPGPPQNRHLFDPNRGAPNQPFSNRGPPPRSPGRFAHFHAQVDFLNYLADVEISKAEIKREDLQAKENLRLSLEEICRLTITKFEQIEDPCFDSSTVKLQCFGSLSSGFATTGSDMDLALISPASKPDTASVESKIPRLIERALLDLGYGARLLTQARVPIIKFCERPTPELAEALIQERLKWEKIKDLPPKLKKAKRGTDSQLPPSPSGSPTDPTLPQNRPNTLPPPSVAKMTRKRTNSRPPSSKSKFRLEPNLTQTPLNAPSIPSLAVHTRKDIIPAEPASSPINPSKDGEIEKKASKKKRLKKAKAMNIGKFLESQHSGNKAISEDSIINSQASQLADNKLKLNSNHHVDNTSTTPAIPRIELATDRLLANGVDRKVDVKPVADARSYHDRIHAESEDLDGTPVPEDVKTTTVIDNRNGQDESLDDNNKEVLVDVGDTEIAPPVRSDEELVYLYKLAISEGWFEIDERKIIYKFADAVKQSSINKNVTELADARAALKSLPDVLKRYRDITDNPLDFPKSGVGIQSDINFSNPLALHNTLLLRCYSHCDARIRPMVLFVKAWAKQRKINSPYQGTLSSYGYVLMVLHFVVNIADPPLAPNLQLAPRAFLPTFNLSETVCDGYNVRFWRSEKEIRDCVARGTLLAHPQNREPLGSLLRSFFQYYAQQGPNVIGSGFSWSLDVLSLRSSGGLLSKQEKAWTGAKTVTIEPTVPGQQSKEVRHRYLFAIEDPFEIDHNVARTVVHNGIVAIRDEFRRANRIIQTAGFDGGVPANLFEEGKDPPSQRTFFGPKPRPVFGPKNLAMELRPGAAGELRSPEAVKGEQLGPELDTKLSVDVPGVATNDIDGATTHNVNRVATDHVGGVATDDTNGPAADEGHEP
ncbi:MAG: hypothetical protein Q9187_005071 [Circinaria calcarea]